MAKSKADYWLTEDGLTLLSGWARDGLTDEQIAHNMGINVSTLYVYKNKHIEIQESLKKNKEIADYEVENALFKKTQGYNAKIKKNIKLKRAFFDEETGKKYKEEEYLVEVEDEVHVPADTLAQLAWLKNRQPEKWRDKPQPTNSEEGVMIVDDIPKLEKDNSKNQ